MPQNSLKHQHPHHTPQQRHIFEPQIDGPKTVAHTQKHLVARDRFKHRFKISGLRRNSCLSMENIMKLRLKLGFIGFSGRCMQLRWLSSFVEYGYQHCYYYE